MSVFAFLRVVYMFYSGHHPLWYSNISKKYIQGEGETARKWPGEGLGESDKIDLDCGITKVSTLAPLISLTRCVASVDLRSGIWGVILACWIPLLVDDFFVSSSSFFFFSSSLACNAFNLFSRISAAVIGLDSVSALAFNVWDVVFAPSTCSIDGWGISEGWGEEGDTSVSISFDVVASAFVGVSAGFFGRDLRTTVFFPSLMACWMERGNLGWVCVYHQFLNSTRQPHISFCFTHFLFFQCKIRWKHWMSWCVVVSPIPEFQVKTWLLSSHYSPLQ